MADLDEEEMEILRAYQDNRLECVALTAEEIAAYRAAAAAVSHKEKRVNIRISARDLEDLQVKAMEEGVPYQTLMASVLHKYVAGRLVAKS